MITTVNRASRAFSDLLTTCLSHHDLTIPAWGVLGYLSSHTQARPIEIAKFLGVKPPFVAKMLSHLETRTYISTSRFPDDERGKMIQLTQTGKDLVEMVEPQLQHCLHEQFHGVDDSQLVSYFSFNNYIADNVHHH
jgi:DNA-binding MarR family transcriptional regulator